MNNRAIGYWGGYLSKEAADPQEAFDEFSEKYNLNKAEEAEKWKEVQKNAEKQLKDDFFYGVASDESQRKFGATGAGAGLGAVLGGLMGGTRGSVAGGILGSLLGFVAQTMGIIPEQAWEWIMTWRAEGKIGAEVKKLYAAEKAKEIAAAEKASKATPPVTTDGTPPVGGLGPRSIKAPPPGTPPGTPPVTTDPVITAIVDGDDGTAVVTAIDAAARADAAAGTSDEAKAQAELKQANKVVNSAGHRTAAERRSRWATTTGVTTPTLPEPDVPPPRTAPEPPVAPLAAPPAAPPPVTDAQKKLLESEHPFGVEEIGQRWSELSTFVSALKNDRYRKDWDTDFAKRESDKMRALPSKKPAKKTPDPPDTPDNWVKYVNQPPLDAEGNEMSWEATPYGVYSRPKVIPKTQPPKTQPPKTQPPKVQPPRRRIAGRGTPRKKRVVDTTSPFTGGGGDMWNKYSNQKPSSAVLNMPWYDAHKMAAPAQIQQAPVEPVQQAPTEKDIFDQKSKVVDHKAKMEQMKMQMGLIGAKTQASQAAADHTTPPAQARTSETYNPTVGASNPMVGASNPTVGTEPIAVAGSMSMTQPQSPANQPDTPMPEAQWTAPTTV